MLRIAFVLAVLLALTSTALAAPVASVGVAPGPTIVQDDREPYYLLAHVGRPELVHEGDESEDCSKGTQRRPLPEVLQELAEHIANWDPRTEPRISGWYPTCFAGTLAPPQTPASASGPASGWVAYDLPSGRYFFAVQFSVTAGEGVAQHVPLGFTLEGAFMGAGTTGIGTQADCETCPPPCC